MDPRSIAVPKMKFKEKLKNAWKKLGPGLITGCSDDDPSGIATYSQAGAKFGLATLWTALITYPMMYFIQEMCARIGIVTGLGLGGVTKKYYSKWILYLLLLVLFPAITFNIAADLAGMGAVAHLLIPAIPPFAFSFAFVIIITIILFFFTYQKVANILKWLCATLFVYMIVPFLVPENWSQVLLSTVIPQIKMNKEFIVILVAILGTTISPYLFLWQANMSVEEKNHKAAQSESKEVQEMKIDVNVGMFFSNIVMYFIILTTASVLFPAGVTHIETVKEAAQALEPLAGKSAYLLFALGVLGTGFLAIPVLAGCLGYLCAEIFNWRKGLDKMPWEAKRFYAIILAAIAIALLLNAFGLSPIQALIYSALLYGLIAPLLIALILHIANSKTIMGSFSNRWLSNVVGLITLLFMTTAVLALIFV